MNGFKKLISVIVLLALVAFPIAAVANAQAIEDWWRLRDYTPPPEIVKLADEDTMTDKSRHLFYVNHPQLIGVKGQFNQACPQSEQTIVLGCYYSGGNIVNEGIAVYDVTDSRLAGVEEVTAAHETLHAAYQRLSSNDKNNINNLLQNYYNSGLTDPRIKATIESYKKTEPNDVVNEMHSVFGTEVANLPAPLEDYYKQYFTNRQAITNYSEQYETVFSQNKVKLDNIKAQIDQLKIELSSDKANIEAQQSYLTSESSRMQGLLSGGSTQQYNAAVAPYNSRVVGLRRLIANYNAKVNQVNSLVEQYNSLAYTQENLYNALDTRVQTQTAQ
jgi:uncharacterized protein YukE